MEKLQINRDYATAGGHIVTIRELHGNFAVGQFDTGSIEFWNLDGLHATDPAFDICGKALPPKTPPAPRPPIAAQALLITAMEHPVLTLAAGFSVLVIVAQLAFMAAAALLRHLHALE